MLTSTLGACAASIPKGSYGVDALDIQGADHVSEEAIKVCLATHPRERFGPVFGGDPAPQCGVPPFDPTRYPVELWAWPWTERPLWNETAFERDLDRIARWYAARGYYDAKVTEAFVQRDEEEREVAIDLVVVEGEPSLIVRLQVRGLEELPADLQEEVRDVIKLELGEPFDEAFYDQSKLAILRVLQEHSYAKAIVDGQVDVDPKKKLVRVNLAIAPGPPCKFGEIKVEGDNNLAAGVILDAADIETGEPFALSELEDARLAVYTLGPFASVETEFTAREEEPIVDVVLRVVRARSFRFGIGVGMSAGQETDEATGDSYAQWDLHLVGRVEHKNFLGGMRKLRVEDRPRLIFDQSFPGTDRSDFGNLLTVELRQPAFVEARTTLVARSRWDLGPDPYGGRFLRDDVSVGLGPERYFFGHKLLLSSSINADLFLPHEDPSRPSPYPNTGLAYLNHGARVDLRDDTRNTQRGSYFAFGIQHAGYFLPSDWNYVRLTQDVRGYVSLPARIVLAGRLRLGMMIITDERISSPDDDAALAADTVEDPRFLRNLASLGPVRHRLRGGGPNSVRGYAPNTLGDAEYVDGRLVSGGLRQWEASLELRVPLTEDFGTVAFADAGDVSRGERFRFDYPQTSFGLGLRYRTIVGPLRLDVAVAPPSLQVIGADRRIRTDVPQSRLPSWLSGADGSLTLTIGEAF